MYEIDQVLFLNADIPMFKIDKPVKPFDKKEARAMIEVMLAAG